MVTGAWAFSPGLVCDRAMNPDMGPTAAQAQTMHLCQGSMHAVLSHCLFSLHPQLLLLLFLQKMVGLSCVSATHGISVTVVLRTPSPIKDGLGKPVRENHLKNRKQSQRQLPIPLLDVPEEDQTTQL